MLMKMFSVIMVMLILQAKNNYALGLMSKVGQWWKPVFLMQSKIKNTQKPLYAKNLHMFKKKGNESDGNIDSPPDNEPTFSWSYFHGEPIFNLEIIKEGLTEMNLHRLQKKETNNRLNNIKKEEQFNIKIGNQHSLI